MKIFSELPTGAMAALLAGWGNHNPYIHWEEHKGSEAEPWVSLFGPYEGPNADWYGHQVNFCLEPTFQHWLRWAAERKQSEIASAIKDALGFK